MRLTIAVLALVLATTTSACAGRQVEVTTGPEPASEIAVRLTNNLTQAVNLYVATGGTDVFLKQVSAGSVELVPVRGLNAGSLVTLRARTVDGTRTYTRDNVSLSSSYEWRVP